MNILEALAKVDPFDDDSWTSDGSVKVEVVSEIMGVKVTRQDIVNAAPHFNRSNPNVGATTEPEEETTDAGEEEGQGPEEVGEALAAFYDADYRTHAEVKTAVYDLPKEGLQDFVQLGEQSLIEIERQIRELQSLRNMTKFAKNLATNRLKVETGDTDNQAAIRRFLEAQHAHRTEQALTTKAVLQGLDLTKIDPRAPIDRAMARKTQRGNTRPIHPVRG